MATLTRRMEEVEERTESLETIFAAFMARTDERIGHLERVVERMEQEGARSREEAARDRRKMDERFGALADSIDRMEQEGAREREAAARERKEMNKRWGELANSMGTVVEDIVAPSIRRLAREVFDCGGLQHFSARTARTRSDAPSHEREFDALYVGTQAVLLNETKASARPEYARAFVRFLESGQFARYFPEYRELPIVPVFSSLSIPADVVTYLTRRGIYAITMGDEAMQVLNLHAVRRRRSAR